MEQAFQSKLNVSHDEFSKEEQGKRGGNYQKKGQYGKGLSNFKEGQNRERGKSGEIYKQKTSNSSGQCLIARNLVMSQMNVVLDALDAKFLITLKEIVGTKINKRKIMRIL